MKEKVSSSPIYPGCLAHICYIDNLAMISSFAFEATQTLDVLESGLTESVCDWRDRQGMRLRGVWGSSFGTGNAGASPSPRFGNLQRFSKQQRYQAPRGRVISSTSSWATQLHLSSVGRCSQMLSAVHRFAQDGKL